MRRVIKYAFFSLVVAVAVCAPRATHLRGHTGRVNGAVFAPDARHFASSSSFDNTVRMLGSKICTGTVVLWRLASVPLQK